MKTLPRALGIVLVALAGTAELAAQGSGAARALVGSIAHTWKPIRDGGPEIVAIDVRTEVTELPASAGDGFSLKVPIVYANVTGIAERTLNLSVRDAAGEVPLTVEDDPPAPGGFPYYRHLRASRRVTFPLAYTYRSLSQTGQFRGPPFGLFSAAGGISGAGSGFLVLPEGDLVVTTRVHWDLSGLAAGATALTSFGDGDFTLRGEPSAPTQGWIMAGVLGGYSSPNGGAFSAAWTGTPAWDPAAEMRWASEMFTWLGKSYGYLNPLPRYRVFIRTGGTRGVGTALDNSFMMSAPPRDAGAPAQGEAPRETITHEMGPGRHGRECLVREGRAGRRRPPEALRRCQSERAAGTGLDAALALGLQRHGRRGAVPRSARVNREVRRVSRVPAATRHPFGAKHCPPRPRRVFFEDSRVAQG